MCIIAMCSRSNGKLLNNTWACKCLTFWAKFQNGVKHQTEMATNLSLITCMHKCMHTYTSAGTHAYFAEEGRPRHSAAILTFQMRSPWCTLRGIRMVFRRSTALQGQSIRFLCCSGLWNWDEMRIGTLILSGMHTIVYTGQGMSVGIRMTLKLRNIAQKSAQMSTHLPHVKLKYLQKWKCNLMNILSSRYLGPEPDSTSPLIGPWMHCSTDRYYQVMMHHVSASMKQNRLVDAKSIRMWTTLHMNMCKHLMTLRGGSAGSSPSRLIQSAWVLETDFHPC